MIFPLLALASAAPVSNYFNIVTESNNTRYNNKSLLQMNQEDYGFYYYYFGETPTTEFYYNATAQTIEDTDHGMTFMQSNVLQNIMLSSGYPYGAFDTTVENNYVAINGTTDVFYACTSMFFDLWGITSEETPVLFAMSDRGTIPDYCHSLNLKVVYT